MNVPTRVVVCRNASTIVIIILWYGVSFCVIPPWSGFWLEMYSFCPKREGKERLGSFFCKTYLGIGGCYLGTVVNEASWTY